MNTLGSVLDTLGSVFNTLGSVLDTLVSVLNTLGGVLDTPGSVFNKLGHECEPMMRLITWLLAPEAKRAHSLASWAYS